MLLSSPINRCYCAFCKSERKFFARKNISVIHIIQAVLCAIFTMYAIWWKLDPRVFILIPLYIVIAEFIVHMRWRIYIVCSHCGFDPVLYAKSPEKAAEQVSAYMKRYEEKAEYSLLPNPKRNLSYRKVPLPPNKAEEETRG